MIESSFVLSPEARDDLDEIWLYISENSIEAADRVEAELRSAIRVLGARPEIGHHRQDLTELPLRFWPVYSYLIVYNAAKRPVEIVRVLHGARDARRLL